MAKKKASKTARKTAKRKSAKKQTAKHEPAVSRSHKSKGGRPPFKPTDEQRTNVETLAGFGLKHDEIRQLVTNPTTGNPIDADTLARHFSAELARGGPKAAANIAKSLYLKAIGDGNQAVTAAIWYSKCRMGWRERVAVDVDVKSGVLLIPASASAEEWIKAAAARAVGKLEPGTEDGET
jgi:hypothetical protein